MFEGTGLPQIFKFCENGDPARISTYERVKLSPIFQFSENVHPVQTSAFEKTKLDLKKLMVRLSNLLVNNYAVLMLFAFA